MFLRFTTDWTDRTDSVLWGKEEIKKFVAFPGLTPLQPDAYAQPRKRASLSDPSHLSGLPTGRRKASKQNSCRRQYKMSLFRGYGQLPQTCQEPILRRTALQAEVLVELYTEGVAPGYYLVVPSRHRSACGVLVIWIPIPTGHAATHSALLPGGQYHE